MSGCYANWHVFAKKWVSADSTEGVADDCKEGENKGRCETEKYVPCFDINSQHFYHI